MSDRLILTAAPEFETAALADLQRARRDLPSGAPDAERSSSDRSPKGRSFQAARSLAPGVLLIELPVSFGELSRALRERPPIFIRHIQPVQREVPLAGELTDLERLAAAARELSPALDPERPFSVQTRLAESAAAPPYGRFDVNERLASILKEVTGAPLDVRAPEQETAAVVTRGPVKKSASPLAGRSACRGRRIRW